MTDDIEDLEALRGEIDRLDEQIAELVVQRVETAESIAAAKSANGTNLVDTDREAVVKRNYETAFEQCDLDPQCGRAMADRLIEVALDHERPIDRES